MMKTCLALILGTLLLTLAPARAAEDAGARIAEEVKQAQDLYAKEDYRNACRAYQKADELAQGKSSPSLVGLSRCFMQVKDQEKAVMAARQALAVAATPEEKSEATLVLAGDLLGRSDEASWTEAAGLYKGMVANSGGAQEQAGLLAALLFLHRDQEASEMLQTLRKQGRSEDYLQQEILAAVSRKVPSPSEDARRTDDFNEHLLRLDQNAPLRVGGKVHRPEILHQTKPEMPPSARRNGLNATVILDTIVDAQGNVRVAKVLKEQPYGLTQAAVDAVRQWTFHPATLDGRPVTVDYVLTVHFQVQRF